MKDKNKVVEWWRNVVGYEGLYEVSSLGQIRRIRTSSNSKTGYILRGTFDKACYRRVSLRKNNILHSHLVHRLVAVAFLGKPHSEICNEVNHINSIRSDNRVENLEWVTRSENIQHSFSHGHASHKHERHPGAKLNKEMVKEIKMYRNQGLLQREIALMFNVTQVTISSVLRGITWG